jgi:hypothetical protein
MTIEFHGTGPMRGVVFEPAEEGEGFAPPPGPAPRKPCPATAASVAVPGHVHTCVGGKHINQAHVCGECRRWWWDH